MTWLAKLDVWLHFISVGVCMCVKLCVCTDAGLWSAWQSAATELRPSGERWRHESPERYDEGGSGNLEGPTKNQIGKLRRGNPKALCVLLQIFFFCCCSQPSVSTVSSNHSLSKWRRQLTKSSNHTHTCAHKLTYKLLVVKIGACLLPDKKIISPNRWFAQKGWRGGNKK